MVAVNYPNLSSSSQLSKLKLSSFDVNHPERPERSRMFVDIVKRRNVPNSAKMSQLKTLLIDKSKSAISGMGVRGLSTLKLCH